jgi:hypothetical protein
VFKGFYKVLGVKLSIIVVDPDLHGLALIRVSWIRIQVQGKDQNKIK